jgi:hypothetical protein
VRIGFEHLDFWVQAFRHGVGNRMSQSHNGPDDGLLGAVGKGFFYIDKRRECG